MWNIIFFLLRQTPCRQFCSLWSASMRRRSRLLSSASGWCTSRSCSSCANSWLQTDRACRYRSRSPCSRSTAAGRDWAREECHHHPAPSTACASGARRGEVSVFGGNKCFVFPRWNLVHGELVVTLLFWWHQGGSADAELEETEGADRTG